MSINRFKLRKSEKYRRNFSETFKISKVREIESGQTRPCEVKKEYDVSYSAIYKWINKYGMSKSKQPERIIVEKESDTSKLQEMRKKIAELERIVGQKQLQIDFKDKMIELAEEHYEVDIKKKFIDKRSTTSGKTGKQ